MIVCIHEDRVGHLPGVKLAILSLLKHCPTLSIIVSFPNAPASFRTWIEPLPNVQFLDDPKLAGLGWNIKPVLLLRLLKEGHNDVLWMDADIIVNRDFRQRFAELDEQTLVVAPEFYWGPQQGGNHRAITWGLEPDRCLPATANTGIVRVTQHHIKLLQAWQFLLNHPAYRHAQSQPAIQRPLAMIGDQEVLTALLGSEGFSAVPLVILERGKDIAQCIGAAGYTPVERIKGLFHAPPLFIHAMGGKPWMRDAYLEASKTAGKPLRQRLRAFYEYLYLELSPYVATARQYREQVDEPAEWMEIWSIPAQFLNKIFFHHPALQGLPLALIEAGGRHLRAFSGGDRRRFKSTFRLESSPFNG